MLPRTGTGLLPAGTGLPAAGSDLLPAARTGLPAASPGLLPAGTGLSSAGPGLLPTARTGLPAAGLLRSLSRTQAAMRIVRTFEGPLRCQACTGLRSLLPVGFKRSRPLA
ncbi:MAG: hypothetical protein AAF958_19905, partial [Planctomycetota bacterium]